jgi:hypothetical protein
MVKGLPRPADKRKLSLFVCAAWRARAGRFLRSGGMNLLRAIGHAEALADGVISKVPREHASYYVCSAFVASSALRTDQVLSERPRLGVSKAVLCNLLCDIFGGPFHQVVAETFWLRWNNGALATLAREIYNASAFDRLPVLGNALEDAGCDRAPVVEH